MSDKTALSKGRYISRCMLGRICYAIVLAWPDRWFDRCPMWLIVPAGVYAYDPFQGYAEYLKHMRETFPEDNP